MSASLSVSAIYPSTNLKNILFATDFSAESMHALPYVTGLAAKLGAGIHLCHIVTPSPLAAGAPEAAPYVYEAAKTQAAEELKTLAESPQLRAFKPNVLLASGPIEDELLTAVRENHIDLIIAGTHGRTGLRRLLLGSVVEAICRVATCPVLTVGPGSAYKSAVAFNRILFPTDLSEDSKKALPYVLRIAKEFAAEVTVLHVMPEEMKTNPDAKSLAEPIRRTMMHAFEKELAGSKPEFVIGVGEAVETILETAGAKKADLIAMGIHNAFLPGVQLRSSTAYRIMAGAQCPVLTCRAC